MAGFSVSRLQPAHSPETALLPRRSQPYMTPGHPRCIRCGDAPGLAVPDEKNQVGVCKAILRSRNTAAPPQRRWAAAQPLPKPPLETGGTRGMSAQGAAAGRSAPWTKQITPLRSTAAAPQAWNGQSGAGTRRISGFLVRL